MGPNTTISSDTFVAAANGDWLVGHIPGATAVITDAGHLANDSIVDVMLSWVGERSSD